MQPKVTFGPVGIRVECAANVGAMDTLESRLTKNVKGILRPADSLAMHKNKKLRLHDILNVCLFEK